jgi:hypothetical protein
MMASRSHDEHERADSLLSALERQPASRAVHFVPPWLESHHLTLQHLMTWTVAIAADS